LFVYFVQLHPLTTSGVRLWIQVQVDATTIQPSHPLRAEEMSRPVDCLGALLVTWLTHAAVWSCAIGHAVLFDCWRRSDQTCLC